MVRSMTRNRGAVDPRAVSFGYGQAPMTIIWARCAPSQGAAEAGTRRRERGSEFTVDRAGACPPCALLTVTRGQPRSLLSLAHPSPRISLTLVSTLLAARSSRLAMRVRFPPLRAFFASRWLVFRRLWTFDTRLQSLLCPTRAPYGGYSRSVVCRGGPSRRWCGDRR